MIRKENVLEFKGFPALGDLQSEDWRILFQRLEREQADFLSHEKDFRSPEYRWPRDPLHTWSRLWEYPYVLYQLEKIAGMKPEAGALKVADIGSGVTFFPFSVARSGYNVTCIDIDPVCERDIPAAAKVTAHTPGKVGVALLTDKRIPLASGSQDVAYCISVLEHIPDFETTIEEIARILKPGGHFILTVDIDLRGDSELGVEAFERMQHKLAEQFRDAIPGRSIHPAALLTSENSPYPLAQKSGVGLAKQLVKNTLNRRVVGGRAGLELYLTVFATVLVRV